jgi:hypothetical protein
MTRGKRKFPSSPAKAGYCQKRLAREQVERHHPTTKTRTRTLRSVVAASLLVLTTFRIASNRFFGRADLVPHGHVLIDEDVFQSEDEVNSESEFSPT